MLRTRSMVYLRRRGFSWPGHRAQRCLQSLPDRHRSCCGEHKCHCTSGLCGMKPHLWPIFPSRNARCNGDAAVHQDFLVAAPHRHAGWFSITMTKHCCYAVLARQDSDKVHCPLNDPPFHTFSTAREIGGFCSISSFYHPTVCLPRTDPVLLTGTEQ